MAIKCEEVQNSNDDSISIVETPPEATPWFHNTKRMIILGILVMTILITIFVIIFVNMSLPKSQSVTYPVNIDANKEEAWSNPKVPSDQNVTLTLPRNVKYISRREWLAQPPTGELIPLSVPVPYVIISNTATEDCSDQASCSLHVRFIQTFHVESRNWFDIGYNFLVGGDGNVYEGRGFKGEGAHTYGYNSKSLGISFIGTFNEVLPPERQIFAAQKLIEKGVEEGYIASNYKLLGTRQLHPTQSPGLKLYENMKTWPHWEQTL